jgi:hypothetical protein
MYDPSGATPSGVQWIRLNIALGGLVNTQNSVDGKILVYET